MRGRKARQEAAAKRAAAVQQQQREQKAAVHVQSAYRQRMARKVLRQRQQYQALLHKSATKMQAAWRARKARTLLGVLRMVYLPLIYRRIHAHMSLHLYRSI